MRTPWFYGLQDRHRISRPGPILSEILTQILLLPIVIASSHAHFDLKTFTSVKENTLSSAQAQAVHVLQECIECAAIHVVPAPDNAGEAQAAAMPLPFSYLFSFACSWTMDHCPLTASLSSDSMGTAANHGCIKLAFNSVFPGAIRLQGAHANASVSIQAEFLLLTTPRSLLGSCLSVSETTIEYRV